MKKLLFSLLLMASVLCISSCALGAHKHTYAPEWKTNETHHYKACTEEGCDSRAAEGTHSFGEGTSVGNGDARYECTVCGYAKIEHSHALDSEYIKDAEGHLRACIYSGCGYREEKSAHTYGDPVPEQDGFNRYTCTVCGYEKREMHSHTFSETLSFDTNGHFYTCDFPGCTERKGAAAHTFGGVFLGLDGLEHAICSACAFERTAAHTHAFSQTHAYDADGHYFACTTEGCGERSAYGAHTYGEGEKRGEYDVYICTVCAYEVVSHEHRLSVSYSRDSAVHWRECTVDGCLYRESMGSHTYGEGVLESDGLLHFICSVCQYEKTETHLHDFSSVTSYDETGHYYVCTFRGCTVQDGFEAHTFGEATIEGENEVYTCLCGYRKVLPHTHDFSGETVITATGHSRACTLAACDAKSEEQRHTYGDAVLTDGKDVYTCTVCGHTRSETHAHVISSGWQRDGESHWKKCNAQGCTYTTLLDAHDWKSAGILVEPTPEQSGTEQFVCMVCSLTKTETVAYVPPKMSREAWLSYFVFDNVELRNTYSFGDGEEYTALWQIDGENILITDEEGSVYGGPEDILTFAFVGQYYEAFSHLGEGRYLAERLTVTDTETETETVYTDVTVCFSETALLSIEFTLDLEYFALTERYEFITFGGVVVPENPRQRIEAPESIDEMLGHSFENFTMEELLTDGEGNTFGTLYLFDGKYYSVSIDGEPPETDMAQGAGAEYAYEAVGFFWGLNAEDFVLDTALSSEDLKVYRYAYGITVGGLDIDAPTVYISYTDGAVSAIDFSYEIDLFGTVVYSYSFYGFGSTEVERPTSLTTLYGRELDRFSVRIVEVIDDWTVGTSCHFDGDDYTVGDEGGSCKDPAALFLSDWLGSLLLLDASHFETVESTRWESRYRTDTAVTVKDLTYAYADIRLRNGHAANMHGYGEYEELSIYFYDDTDQELLRYDFTSFGETHVHLQAATPRPVPDGYKQTLVKNGSLGNYTLRLAVDTYTGGEWSSSTTVYEFDLHRGRYYDTDYPELVQYISEEWAGMAFATELLSVFDTLDTASFEGIPGKTSGGVTQMTYVYNGAFTLNGMTGTELDVVFFTENGTLSSLEIRCRVKPDPDASDAILYTYSFHHFGTTAVALPEEEAVLKFDDLRIAIDNYHYYTSLTQSGVKSYTAEGRYDGADYFEHLGSSTVSRYGVCENAGLRELRQYFGSLLNVFAGKAPECTSVQDIEKYDYARVYTAMGSHSVRLRVGGDIFDAVVLNLTVRFFYNIGDDANMPRKITVEYDAVIGGASYHGRTEIVGLGEQDLTPPSEREIGYDAENTDEFCSHPLDNFRLHVTERKPGVSGLAGLIGIFDGAFEKGFASYAFKDGTAVTDSFLGAGEGLGLPFFDDWLGFLYAIPTSDYSLYSADENTVTYRVNKILTVEGGKVYSVVITLGFYGDDKTEVTVAEITYRYTSQDGTQSKDVIATVSSFGKTVITLPEALVAPILSPAGQSYAKEETLIVDADGVAVYKLQTYCSDGVIILENQLGSENDARYTYTTAETLAEGYREHFDLTLGALALIGDQAICSDLKGFTFTCSPNIVYGGYRIENAKLEYSYSVADVGDADTGTCRITLTGTHALGRFTVCFESQYGLS